MNIITAFKQLVERNRRQLSSRRKILRSVADKLGLVYFGFVDQHTDDHKVIRGFSTSATHRDDSYIVGEFEGLSVAIVDRFDSISDGRTTEHHSWLVLNIELPASADFDHMFLLPTHQTKVHYKKIFNAFRSLERIVFTSNVSEFNSRYEVYAKPDHHSNVDTLLTSEHLNVFAAHFWPLAIEVDGQNVYLYYADHKITEQTVQSMLKNSAWLVQTLENSLKNVD
jgi:hypothetical protein